MKLESPYLAEGIQPREASEDWQPSVARLLRESPFAQVSIPDEVVSPDEWQDAEFFDDEERDAQTFTETPSRDAEAAFEQQVFFETEDDGVGSSTEASSSPLGEDQRTWMFALDHSAIERLPDAAKRRRYLTDVHWSSEYFPGNKDAQGRPAAGLLAEELFRAMATVVPERRVPSLIAYHDPVVVEVPDQKEHRLFAEARDAFVRMRDAAKADGVHLVITSSWRSRKKQAAISSKQPNPKAAAKGKSAHMYGLAVDLRMSVAGLPVVEANTRTPEKMANVVRMYRSPVYKWMALRGREFGWYPYRREPWHWEYNPPGFKARFEKLASRDPGNPSVSDHLGGKLWTFTAATLQLPVSVFCPTAAISQAEVDLLVYAHGLLDRCEGPHTVPGIITQSPFKLAQIINDAHRAIVLVAPHLNWGSYKDAHPMGEPAKLNGVLAEVLNELGRVHGGAAPTVRNLIIAGHSRAYGVLEPLAGARADRNMQQGALAKLSQVWAFDTTYKGRVDAWMAWLDSNPRLAISVFYRPGSKQQRTAGKKLTWAVGDQFYSRKGGRLTVERVPEKHCDVPPTRLPALLARSPSVQQESEDWPDRGEVSPDSGFNSAEAYADDPDATEAEFDGEYVADELSIDDLLDDVPIEPEDDSTEPEAHDDADEAAETAFTSHDEAAEEALDDIADETLGDTLTELDTASTPETELFESAPTGDVVAEDAEISPAARRCQQEWLTAVAAYPTEVRNAIANAPTHGALDVYLWAVRKGMRDEAKLRRLIYFTLYGSQHGYCEPATSVAKTAWKDVGTLIRAYKKWPQPPRAQTGAEPCPKSGAPPVPPDKPALDINGRYYTLHPPATFVINQAGQHIEGVASYVIDSSSAKSGDHRPVTEFQGDLHSRRYQWFNSYRPSNFGQIAESKGKLFISQGVGANNETVWEQLRPIARIQRSTLIRPGDIDRSFDLIDRHELTPLTPEQMQFIRLILDKDKLEQIFKLYFNGQKRDEAMGFLIRRLVDTPGHASYVARMEKFHEVDLPLVREYARQVLTFQKWKSQRNVIRSHGDWIQMMMDRTMQPGALAAPDFKRFLGLNADPQRARSDGEHTYEFTIKLTGASLVLAGYAGTVLIEKKTGGRTWKRPFDIELWGANAAIDLFDAKIDSELKGAARSYLEWTENDVPGSVRIARVSASIGMDIASTQAGFMHVFGDKSLPPLDVFFQEAKLGVPNINKILEEAAKGKVEQLMKKPGGLSPKGVLGLDVGFSALFGSISPPGSLLERLRKAHKAPDVIDLSRDLKSDVSVMRAFSSQTHFCRGDDRLTEAAVQALRIICARELPLFMSKQSYLLVIGHADTLGRGRYDNESLSKRRAENTIQAIKDVLGGKFNNGMHIRAVAAGDKLAAQESGNKAVAAPKHRRVQVFLNSVLVLTLFGSSSVP